MRTPWRFQPDALHGFTEQLAIFSFCDRRGIGADHFHAMRRKNAGFVQVEGRVQGRLAAHGGEQRKDFARGHIYFLADDDLFDKFRRDRLDIGRIRKTGICHDRGGVRIDQNDAIALGAQRLARLRPGVIEFAGLPDDDRAGPNDQDGVNVGAARHIRYAVSKKKPPRSRG